MLRQRGRSRARPGLVRPGRRQRARQRPRPVLPRLAGRRAAERLLAGPAGGRRRDAAVDRRAVRRRPLRHGDADDERHLRAHLGRARRPAAGRRLLADRDPGASKRVHPDFVFIAEAYWDLEWALQQQGFDYCYDKRLYDRLVHDGAEQVRGHLTADTAYQDGLVRFIENHDEPRAAATFPPREGARGGGGRR